MIQLLRDSEARTRAILREALVQIDQQTRRAGGIINRLKRFMSGAAPKQALVELHQLLSEVDQRSSYASPRPRGKSERHRFRILSIRR